MKTILIILGKETSEFAKGDYNKGLFESAIEFLGDKYEVLTTDIESGYKVKEEIEKYKKADAVIYQYPIYWFMPPSSLKKYMDEVFEYGEFFHFTEGPYGTGGLMKNKKFMISTTWNAPESAFEEGGFYYGFSPEDIQIAMRKSNTFCGMEELKHFSCHDIVKTPDFEKDKKRYIDHLKKVFF